MWKLIEVTLFIKELKRLAELMAAKFRLKKKKDANHEAIKKGDPTILQCALSGDCDDDDDSMSTGDDRTESGHNTESD